MKDFCPNCDFPAFTSRPDSLTVPEARYFQDLLYRIIKIGTEVEFALPKGVLRDDLQPRIEKALQPSRDMNRLGTLGVYDVIKEHCGIEILVIGRHPHWDALLRQYRGIILPLLKEKIRIRPTCGLHFHLLGIGLAEEIPEIILANFWNMTRIFAPGLKYITSGGKSRKGLCRRRQHNAHQEFIKHSPADHSMREIQEILKKSFDVPEHQNFLNLEHIKFSEQGAVTDIHVEMRFPDGDLCPVSITAKTFLFLTMLLKAVEISKFGLLNIEECTILERNSELMDMISNNEGKVATSDTGAIDDVILQEYRKNTLAMLTFLKSIFLILDNPGEAILHQLALLPISLRRDRADSWEKIEEDLSGHIPIVQKLDTTDYELIKIIELGIVLNRKTEADWHTNVATILKIKKGEIARRLANYTDRTPTWQPDLGSVVFLR